MEKLIITCKRQHHMHEPWAEWLDGESGGRIENSRGPSSVSLNRGIPVSGLVDGESDRTPENKALRLQRQLHRQLRWSTVFDKSRLRVNFHADRALICTPKSVHDVCNPSQPCSLSALPALTPILGLQMSITRVCHQEHFSLENGKKIMDFLGAEPRS